MPNGPISFVGGVGGIGPQRIGNGKSIPSAITRYFRRNEGTTDYAQFAAPITLAGDFVIEFDGQTSTTSDNAFIGTDVASDAGFVSVSSDGTCILRHTNEWFSLGSITPDNSLHRFRVERSGATVSLYVDDNLIGSTAFSGLWYAKTIWRAMASGFTGLVYTNGILANLKIWDNGVLTHWLPIDDGGDILANKATTLGEELTPIQDYSDPFWVGIFTDGGIGSFSTTAGGQGPRTVQDSILEEGVTYKIVISNMSAGVGVFFRDNTAIPLISNSNGEFLFTVPAVSSGRQLYMRASVAGTHTATVSVRRADGYATVINGNAEDWGEFKEEPTLWKGQDLTVPPWDSVDQELLKA